MKKATKEEWEATKAEWTPFLRTIWIRHAGTPWTERQRLMGDQANPAPTAAGLQRIKKAAMMAFRINRHLGEYPITEIFSSPKKKS